MAALLSGLLASGCAGSGDDARPGAGELADYLPPAAPQVAVVDFDALRSELGLAADADVSGFELAELEPDEQRLVRSGALVLPQVRVVSQLLIDDDPLAEAMDGSLIHAAAADLFTTRTAAIATDQPFDEIAEVLSRRGFVERDGILSNPANGGEQGIGSSIYSAVAEGPDGVVLVAGSDDTLAALVADPAGGPEALRAVLERPEGATRIAAEATPFASPPASAACIVELAIGEDLGDSSGEIIFELDGEADPAGFDPEAAEAAGLDASEPTADGQFLSVPYSFAADEEFTPLAELFGTGRLGELYDCP